MSKGDNDLTMPLHASHRRPRRTWPTSRPSLSSHPTAPREMPSCRIRRAIRRYSAIVGGVGLKNVSLTGGGVLDGMGYDELVFGMHSGGD